MYATDRPLEIWFLKNQKFVRYTGKYVNKKLPAFVLFLRKPAKPLGDFDSLQGFYNETEAEIQG